LPHFALLKRRDLDVVGVARHVDDRLMSAGVVQAGGDQVMHALLAHVAEGHGRAGWAALSYHSTILVAAGVSGFFTMIHPLIDRRGAYSEDPLRSVSSLLTRR
jgi:hypothetical protein